MPSPDPGEFPDLEPLPEAAAEVRALRRRYPRATVLADGAATVPALAHAMGRATVVHFAGHAVFDVVRPERSFLALAGRGARARLGVQAVRGMRLDRVRLVVLAACRTAGGIPGAIGGGAGLASALRAAGVRGVVASAWQAPDAETAALMLALHDALLAGRSPSDALRDAQRALLAGPPPLRNPAAWAAFRLDGR